MREPDKHITDVLLRYFIQELNSRDQKELDEWLNERDEHRVLLDKFKSTKWFVGEWIKFNSFHKQAHWDKLRTLFPELDRQKVVPVPARRLFRPLGHWMEIAACLIALSVLFWPEKKESGQPLSSLPKPAPRHPFTTLSLFGGTTDTLEKYSIDQLIADQGKAEIHKTKDGIVYREKGSPPAVSEGNAGNMLNTLSTSVGAWCKLVLSDSSEVKVSPGSSLSYATTFRSGRRTIDLQGEAIFKVETLPTKGLTRDPFVVHVSSPAKASVPTLSRNDLTIVATGTLFKVKAFDSDSSIHALLLTGTISVQKNGDPKKKSLQPGEEYVLYPDGTDSVRRIANLTAAASWKDGEFEYIGQPLGYILRDLARWYDLTIDYPDKQLSDQRFNLYGFRNEPVESLLNRLEETHHVRFIPNGKNRFIVSR